MLDLNTNQEEEVPEQKEFAILLDSLLTILKKEVEVYEELLSIAIEGGSVLKKASLELISENHNKMETCLLKAKMLEEARGKAVKKIAMVLDVEERDINLTVLCDRARGKQKTELYSIQTTLTRIISTLKKANDESKALLDYSLFYVGSTMSFIGSILSAGAGYAETGKLKAGTMNGKILSREG